MIEAAREKLEQAEQFALLPERIWPLTYQDGVASTLRWLLGEGRDPLDPSAAEIPARLLDVRHRLPQTWRHDFESLTELVPEGRSGWSVDAIPWLPGFLADTVPLILCDVLSFEGLRLDDRLGQHIIAVTDDDWFPWHTHGFEDSYVAFVLYPFTRDEGSGGEIKLSSGEVFTPRAGHAAVFDGRATAHCVAATAPRTPPRYSISAFYRSERSAS